MSKYHYGECECDEELFVDWDEDCHGPMDTPDNRKDYPENFVWSCCGESLGESDGCNCNVDSAIAVHKWTHAFERAVGKLTIMRDSTVMFEFVSTSGDFRAVARSLTSLGEGLFGAEEDGGIPHDEVRSVATMIGVALAEISESM